MNLFYTGLGIARSLGEQGIPVIGLTSQRGVYGNFSRYSQTILCPDSRNEPEALVAHLLKLGATLQDRAVIFPTRDHDLVFLDRFRHELARFFIPVVTDSAALDRALNKWETYRCAKQAGVPTPRSWLIQSPQDLLSAAEEITYPCVVKPLAAHHWRGAANWELVGSRKAIPAGSRDALFAEYATVGRADQRVLVQECIRGEDDCLFVAACYVDRRGNFQGGFNIQKLVQTPAGFGTGCIVQSVNRPELFEPTIRLLRAMQFTGIAEVEYKWDATDGEFKLIEVNPRPWDQHRLGPATGDDLIHLAYCDHAALGRARVQVSFSSRKWVAEDAFLFEVLRLLWRREPGLGALLQQARGPKVYAIWSIKDPLPFVAYVASLVPRLFRLGWQAVVRSTRSLFGIRPKAAVRVTP